MIKKRERKSQIWVETVIYTLIGLSILGIVLGIATPKIRELIDRAAFEQTLTLMNEINEKISIVRVAEGSSRPIDLKIKRGEFTIDSKREMIFFKLDDSRLKFSQPGENIPYGDIIILTEENEKRYNLNAILDYAGSLNITFNGEEMNKTLTRAPTPYRLLLQNKGGGNIDFSLI